jgi:N-acetylglucosaminyldiphosphoundecaprenol N-acetyl-beta-D-mannosaminyltransferase
MQQVPKLATSLINFWQRLSLPIAGSTAEVTPRSYWQPAIYVLGIFLLALIIRFFHFVDLAPLVTAGKQDFYGITAYHQFLANGINTQGLQTIFPANLDPRDTNLLQYPPGYAIFLSVVYYLLGDDPLNVLYVQGLLNALTVVMVFFVISELFDRRIAGLAAVAVAISHHLAYFSLLLLPDALVPTLIVGGSWAIIRSLRVQADRQRGYRELVIAGICYGLACWLRSDALLLAPFWGLIFLILRRPNPIFRAALLTATVMLVISPLTVRNYRLYGRFVPISLGLGVVLQSGVGEADPSLGLPYKDDQTMLWEAEHYQQPAYTQALMSPDGFFREQERIKRSLAVIKARPFWYLTVMGERVNLMLKYSAHAPLIRTTNPQGMREFSRSVARGLQRVFKETLLPLLILGVLLGLKNRRYGLLLLTVPIYYLASHACLHAEFRYALPAHYFLFVFYAFTIYMLLFDLPAIWRQRQPGSAASLDDAFPLLPSLAVTNTVATTTAPTNLGFARWWSRIECAGVKIDNLSQIETIQLIQTFISRQQPALMTVVNASKLVLASEDQLLQTIIQQSEIVTADGMSVVWASRFLGTPLKERVTGIDTFNQLLQVAAGQGYKVYFLGARPEVVQSLVRKVQADHPQLAIVGYHDGYFGHNETVIAAIKAARPDILFVAMGSPRQEKWLAAHKEILQVPFAIGVGGSFDHYAGFMQRAPRWMQRYGLEWVHRLWQEPRRLWRRYLVGNTRFAYLVIRDRLTRYQ